MPDDKIDEIDKSAEQDQETGDGDPDSALSSFLEDDDDDKGGGEDDEVEKKPDEKKPDEKKAKEKETDGEDSEDEYPDELKERLKQPEKKPDEAKPPEQETPPEKPPEKKPEPEKKPDDFSFAEIDDADLPDKEIKIGGHSINLKEYRTDYPEDYAAIIAIGSAVARKQVEDLLNSGELVRKNDIVPLYEDKATREEQAFLGKITQKHPDALKYIGDDADADFVAWLSEQEEPLQRLARNMETPEDGILILDYYKKSIGKKKAKAHDSQKKTEQKRHVDIHKGSMRGKSTAKGGDSIDMNDAKAAFEEDDDDDY